MCKDLYPFIITFKNSLEWLLLFISILDPVYINILQKNKIVTSIVCIVVKFPKAHKNNEAFLLNIRKSQIITDFK